MADTTTIYGWPYQEATDPPDGASLGQDLAEAIETTVDGIDDRVTAAETDIDTAQADITTLQGKTTGKPLCILRKSTVTSVDNAGENLVWDTEDVDSAGIHSTVSNTGRITPNVAGWYRITATVHWASNATGRRATAILVNGANARYGQIAPGSSAGTISTTVTRTLQANGTTDYFEVFAYQDSGGALNTADTVGTVFEAEFVRN